MSESNCCGAEMFNGMCGDCKEHCTSIEEEEVEEIPLFKGTMESLNNLTIQ